MEVDVKDIPSKLVCDVENHTFLNLGISLKISISELFAALQQFHRKGPTPAVIPKEKPVQKEQAPMSILQPGLLPAVAAGETLDSAQQLLLAVKENDSVPTPTLDSQHGNCF